MLGKMLVTMKLVTVLFGIWMLATGALLVSNGWKLKEGYTIGWIILAIGILSAIAGVMMLFDTGAAAIGISTLLGLQAILTGLGFILLAIVKRAAVHKFKTKIASFRSGLQ
jgi:uncharacterized membrane protein HdeD (DUF308 family)